MASRTSGSAKVRMSAGDPALTEFRNCSLPIRRASGNGANKEWKDERRITGVARNEFVPLAHAVILRGRGNRQRPGAGEDARDQLGPRHGKPHRKADIRAKRDDSDLVYPEMINEPRHVSCRFTGIVDLSPAAAPERPRSGTDGYNDPDAAFLRFLLSL